LFFFSLSTSKLPFHTTLPVLLLSYIIGAVYRAWKNDPKNCCLWFTRALCACPTDLFVTNFTLIALWHVLLIAVTLFMVSWSSAWVVTEIFCFFDTKVVPLSPRSCEENRGSEARVNRIVFKGQPCRTEHRLERTQLYVHLSGLLICVSIH